MLIMSCLLLGKTPGFDWRAQPDVWKVWVPGIFSVLSRSYMFRTGKGVWRKISFLMKFYLFLSTAYRRKFGEEKAASSRMKEAEEKWAKEMNVLNIRRWSDCCCIEDLDWIGKWGGRALSMVSIRRLHLDPEQTRFHTTVVKHQEHESTVTSIFV